jgi:DNA-3-methyladenine glycosylase
MPSPRPRSKPVKPAQPVKAPAPLATEASLVALRAARLPRSFYARDVAEVARALIGCAIVHGERAAMIVETEAYGGPEDLASHARFGRTARTEPMFGPPGHAYVYLCYGTHQMFNVSTGEDGKASAVLIRAVAPVLAIPADPAIGRGPGKLTAALGIDRSLDRLDLTVATSELWLAELRRPEALNVGPRVGVDFAGEWAAEPLRFTWRGHPSVSRPAPVTPWP